MCVYRYTDALSLIPFVKVLDTFEATVAPLIPTLQAGLVHNDGNDHNIILDDDNNVVSIIDFGDMCWTPRVFSFAVAMAYGMSCERGRRLYSCHCSAAGQR